MKKLVAIVALAVILAGIVAPPAHAHGASNAALALAAFAAFNVLFLPFTLAAAVLTPPAVYAPPAYAYSPPVYSAPAYSSPSPTYSPQAAAYSYPSASPGSVAPAAPKISREVVYPHGRYLLYGDGVNKAFQWVWIPNPPPPGSAPGY